MLCFESLECERSGGGGFYGQNTKAEGKMHKFTDLKTISMRGRVDRSFSCGTGVVVGASQLVFGWLEQESSGCLSQSICSRAQFLLFRAEMESSYLDLVPESLIEIMACGVL